MRLNKKLIKVSNDEVFLIKFNDSTCLEWLYWSSLQAIYSLTPPQYA